MRRRTRWMAVLALLCAAPRAAAQTPATPEQTARAFLAALDARRWTEAAAFLSDAAVRRERDLTLSFALAELEQTQKRTDGGSFVVTSSGTVDSTRLKRFAGRRVAMRGVSTLGEVAALEPREFLARMMENATVGPPGVVMRPTRHRYIGIVVENDSVAHALFREEGGLQRVDQAADVLELRREAGRWYVVPNTMMLVRGSLLFDVPSRG